MKRLTMSLLAVLAAAVAIAATYRDTGTDKVFLSEQQLTDLATWASSAGVWDGVIDNDLRIVVSRCSRITDPGTEGEAVEQGLCAKAYGNRLVANVSDVPDGTVLVTKE